MFFFFLFLFLRTGKLLNGNFSRGGRGSKGKAKPVGVTAPPTPAVNHYANGEVAVGRPSQRRCLPRGRGAGCPCAFTYSGTLGLLFFFFF